MRIQPQNPEFSIVLKTFSHVDITYRKMNVHTTCTVTTFSIDGENMVPLGITNFIFWFPACPAKRET